VERWHEGKDTSKASRFEAKGHSMKKGPFDGKSPSIANAHRWQRQGSSMAKTRSIDGKDTSMANAQSMANVL
jgi:hypothetical protein